ncbi:hypothetical protein AB0A05_38095 [Streptomyces sp. NPDC046374]|uniref:hypothetical protein n=1 Tax=Streptomyces sp. NPDC046374 TaxID=3154917 RepID=UPI0033F6B793
MLDTGDESAAGMDCGALGLGQAGVDELELVVEGFGGEFGAGLGEKADMFVGVRGRGWEDDGVVVVSQAADDLGDDGGDDGLVIEWGLDV